MTQQHPITPPPELVRQWITSLDCPESWGPKNQWIADKAAQWGADQELEACCEWLEDPCCADMPSLARDLKHSRRSKPPSLKEQALTEFDSLLGDSEHEGAAIILRALEQLPDHE